MRIALLGEDKNILTRLLRRLESINDLDIKLLSTAILENQEMDYLDRKLPIDNVSNYKLHSGTDFAIFLCSEQLSERYTREFSHVGCTVLDSSNFNYEKNNRHIPALIHGVNQSEIVDYMNSDDYGNLIKLPAAATIQLVKILNPLKNVNELRIRKVVVSTYQSVSNLGKNAMDELFNHTKKLYENSFMPAEHFKKQITFNVLPQIGNPLPNGFYGEEERIKRETGDLLGIENISPTSVMVPVFVGDCQSVNVEFDGEIDLDYLRDIYEDEEDSLTLQDRPEEFVYATPKEVALENTVFISRLRYGGDTNSLSLFSVADNVELTVDNVVRFLRMVENNNMND